MRCYVTRFSTKVHIYFEIYTDCGINTYLSQKFNPILGCDCHIAIITALYAVIFKLIPFRDLLNQSMIFLSHSQYLALFPGNMIIEDVPIW